MPVIVDVMVWITLIGTQRIELVDVALRANITTSNEPDIAIEVVLHLLNKLPGKDS